MKDSSKNKLISVRVSSRVQREIEQLLEDTGNERPELLRSILISGLQHYRSELFDRNGERTLTKGQSEAYRRWAMNDDDDELIFAIKEHVDLRFKELEGQINKRLDAITDEMTKRKGFFK